MNTQERIKEAEKAFANHTATYNKFGKVAVLDWKNKNGSSNGAVRYVMLDDVLYISGDLGSAVVQLKEWANLANISHYRLEYFMKRIECSTDLYDFDTNEAEKEIRDYIYEMFEDAEYPLDENEQHKVELAIYDLIENATDDGIVFTEYADRTLNGIIPEQLFEENEFLEFGKSVSANVLCWYVGFRMAYENLKLQQVKHHD